MHKKHKVNFFYTARFNICSIIISTLKFPYTARFNTFTMIISTYDFPITAQIKSRLREIRTYLGIVRGLLPYPIFIITQKEAPTQGEGKVRGEVKAPTDSSIKPHMGE